MEITESHGHAVDTNIVLCHLPRLHSGGSEEEKEKYERLNSSHWKKGRDFWWHEEMKDAATECEK